MENEKTITDRINEVLKENNLRRADLSRGTGIGESTIRGWISDGKTPSVTAAQKVAQYLGVSLDWLVTGKGETPPINKAFTPEEQELIDIFRILDERDKRDLLENARNKKSHYSDTAAKSLA